MFEINLSVPQHDNLVDINTTHHRGLTPEELAEQCVSKIISISETAPHGNQEQARAFQTHLEKLVAMYMKQAVSSDRTTVYNALVDAGEPRLADLIRRL